MGLQSTLSEEQLLKRLFALVILVGLVVLGLAYTNRLPPGLLPKGLGPVGARLEEARLAASVKTALGLHRDMKGASVDVSSEDGVVTLRGTVASDAARETAARVAGAVPGVRQVVSHLEVVASPSAPKEDGRTLGENLDDHTLEVEVRLALSLRRELEGSDIEVRAYRRQVVLVGEVASDAARQTAVTTVRETAGVAGVLDRLRVRGAPARDPVPGAARQAAEDAIRANPHLAAFRIEVVEEEGRLVLRGRVRTGAEKDLAGFVARDAAGSPVDNSLQIHP
jgi:hyperosmotically inducible periplasmic protein